jgi:hypothetical protein
MMKQLVTLSLLSLLLPAGVAFAGGELSASGSRASASAGSAASTRAHIAGLQAGLYNLEARAALAAESALIERKKLVSVVKPVQDKFGDPMYTFYGPLPVEKGTPSYDGPRYAASFDRGYMQPMPDGEYRGYMRGRYSQPGIISHTDTVLGVAANNSYMQHGMQVAPGSMAPSAARVMINNP